jgi:hypothetical protein
VAWKRRAKARSPPPSAGGHVLLTRKTQDGEHCRSCVTAGFVNDTTTDEGFAAASQHSTTSFPAEIWKFERHNKG